MSNPAPIVIMVANQVLDDWTNLKLNRARKQMTGLLTLEMFFSNLPSNPVMRQVAAGAEIQAYIGGQLAFVGTIDSRTGSGKGKHKGHKEHEKALNDRNLSGVDRAGKNPTGAGIHTYADSESYKVTIEARGKCKRLINSSHDHPTGQMKNTTVPSIFKALTKNFNVEVKDNSNDQIPIERAVFRDGALVYTELFRWVKEHNLFAFEGRDGKLNLTVDGNEGSGEPLILGLNILSFSATQSDGQDNSVVTIKGQRSGIAYHGINAIMNKVQTTNPAVTDYSPLILPMTGDASPDRLKKRAKYETDRATQDSKKITIDVFHVQASNGNPWDINVTHYVEIPPEGIYNEFVVDELTYFADAKGVLKTELILVPVANQASSGNPATSDATAYGQSRAAQSGLSYSQGSYPSPWTIPPVVQALIVGETPPSAAQSSPGIVLPTVIAQILPQGFKG